MAASAKDKAEGRAGTLHETVRDLLSAGDSGGALTEAVRRLRAEAKKVRGRRPADGALIDAWLAGAVAALSGQLATHRPQRPAACPRVPRPIDLLTVFETALTHGEGE
jgi:hypothetical protein